MKSKPQVFCIKLSSSGMYMVYGSAVHLAFLVFKLFGSLLDSHASALAATIELE
jgi:hypothetical protein